MARALLLVPNFWDPLCTPMGIATLKAFAERAGHQVDIFDFNTLGAVTRAQRAYFDEGRRQLPHWQNWNIERNGAETLALHQVLYLFGRERPDYPELVAEILNLDRRPLGQIADAIDVARFDGILAELYQKLGSVLDGLLDRSRPDVIGCTLNNTTWPGTLFALERAKRRLPGIRTVVGGPGPLMGIASRADEVRTFFEGHDFIDFYVVAEGEEPFVDILENPDLPGGIVDRQAGLSVPEAKAASLDLDSLPAPDFSGLSIPHYLMLSASSSRGCPFECSFCAETVFWKGFRRAGASNVFKQVDELAQRHKRGSFFICDSLSNHVIGPLTSDIAAHGRPYKLDCYLRADEICTSEKRTKAWREGGLFRARMGLESASQRILDAMVKMTNPDRIARSLRALASQGVMTSTLWIVHFPGETDAEFDDTLRFIGENADFIYQADAQVYQYHPEGLAGSEAVDAEQGSDLRFSPAINQLLSVTPYRVARGHDSRESYERLERWVDEMRRLGIPNPYRIEDWAVADKRWKGMGRDAGWSPRESLRTLPT